VCRARSRTFYAVAQKKVFTAMDFAPNDLTAVAKKPRAVSRRSISWLFCKGIGDHVPNLQQIAQQHVERIGMAGITHPSITFNTADRPEQIVPLVAWLCAALCSQPLAQMHPPDALQAVLDIMHRPHFRRYAAHPGHPARAGPQRPPRGKTSRKLQNCPGEQLR
jgi:hypothetical protein